MGVVFDGKTHAATISQMLKQEIADYGLHPHLAIVLVGEDPASHLYVEKKIEAAREIGAEAEILRFAEDVREGELLRHIRNLNEDKSVTGIMVQLPLPKGLAKERILPVIDPKKDVDGLTKGSAFVGATPRAVLAILQQAEVSLKGARAVVIGSSDLVGKPVASLLLDQGATVTVLNDQTKDLGSFTQQADILISSTGVPHLIGSDMIRDGVVVVDVGISKQKDGSIVGDIDFASVSPKASFITPVPGGVGPMTVIMLLSNLVDSSR